MFRPLINILICNPILHNAILY